jgi:hypothetical protein
VGLRAGLDRCGKPRPSTGIGSPDRPARSESLYRLHARTGVAHNKMYIFAVSGQLFSLSGGDNTSKETLVHTHEVTWHEANT